MIQVFKPSMTQEEIDAVAEVLRSGWIGLGPKTAEFEKKFAEFVGTTYAVAVNSCTAALDLALKLLDVNHGHEVIVPTMTFVSTAHCVAYRLAMPVFADVDPHTLSMDLDDVRRKITSRTRAIIPVHYSGRPIDLDALKEIAGEIPIIEDCAHATGARYKGRSVGSIGDIGCFSFHAVKNLAMGDGGALTLNSEPWMQRSKRLRWLGIDKGTWDRTATDKSYWWQYFVDEIGLKCHLNDIAAAIGLVQLRRLGCAQRPPPRNRPPLYRGLCRLRFHGNAAGRHGRHRIVVAHLLPQGAAARRPVLVPAAKGHRHGRALHAGPPLLVLRQQAASAAGRRGLQADRLAAHVSRHDRRRHPTGDRFDHRVLRRGRLHRLAQADGEVAAQATESPSKRPRITGLRRLAGWKRAERT